MRAKTPIALSLSALLGLAAGQALAELRLRAARAEDRRLAARVEAARSDGARLRSRLRQLAETAPEPRPAKAEAAELESGASRARLGALAAENAALEARLARAAKGELPSASAALHSLVALVDRLEIEGSDPYLWRFFPADLYRATKELRLACESDPVGAARTARALLREPRPVFLTLFLARVACREFEARSEAYFAARQEILLELAEREDLRPGARAQVIFDLSFPKGFSGNNKALPALEALALEPEPIHDYALMAIARMPTPEACAKANAALADPRERSKVKSAILCHIKGRVDLPVLIGLLSDPSPEVRRYAYIIAENYQTSPPSLRSALEARARLEDDSGTLGELGAALTRKGDARSLAHLEAIAADPSAPLRLRAFARSVLERRGPR